MAILVLLALLLVTPGPTGGDVAVEDGFAVNAERYVRRSLAAPTEAELDALAGLARALPLIAAAPPEPARIRIRPPDRPVADRNAAVEWTVRGTPGDTVRLRLVDGAGALDSAAIVLGMDGASRGAFRVRPTRSGWSAWSIALDTLERATGAWVRPAAPLRVLVADAPGSVEAREVARALERAGAEVTLGAALGRGLRLGEAPPGLPADSDALADFDVVIVLSGTDLAGRGPVIDRHLQAGGGVLLAGAAAGLRVMVGEPQPIEADSIRWLLPASIEALPSVDFAVGARLLRGGGTPMAEPSVVRLGFAGRGRWAALGLDDTWRWALEGGRPDALAAFWRTAADWLAGGLSSPVTLSVEPVTAAPGVPVHVRLDRFEGEAPATVLLTRPDGTVQQLPVAWSDDEGRARFVADAEGSYAVGWPGAASVAGHYADAGAGPADAAWARLGVITAGSGGYLGPPDSFDRTRRPARPDRRSAMVALIVLLAFVEWTVRRLRGWA